MYMNAQFTLCHAGINFIGRVYMGKDMDKRDRTRTSCPSLVIAI